MKKHGLAHACRRFTTATSSPTATSVAAAVALRASPGACSSSSGDASRSDSSDSSGDIVALAKAFSETLDEDQFENLNQHYSFNAAAAWSDLPQGILTEAIAGATGAERNEGRDEKIQHLEADDHLAGQVVDAGEDIYGRGTYVAISTGDLRFLLSRVRPAHARVKRRMSGEPAELGVYRRLAHERHPFTAAPEPIAHARLRAARLHMARISHTTVATDGPASDLEDTDAS